MKNKWIIVLLSLASASFGQQQENQNQLECDCPSCREKAESGKLFTLPGLQGLEEPAVAEQDHPGEEQARKPAHPEEKVLEAMPHDHDGDGVPDHEPDEGHEEKVSEAVPHDHDGDGVPDHESDEGHEEDAHEGHDHGPVEGIKLTQAMFDTLGIEVREAAGGTVSKTSVFPAEIKLNRDTTAAISPRYASIVREVHAEIGDEVRKGAVLALLENRETMAVYTMTSPLDGVIITKDLAVGEIVGDDTVLFEVADLSSVWADISVFPYYQHLLRKGMVVNFIAHDGCTAEGQIKYISPIISHETRTFTARCILRDARADFTPGAFVRAKVNVQSVDSGIVVPREAVQTLEGEQVVFVPSPNGFIPEVVVPGLADDHNVELISGLTAGAKYAAVGAFALKAQMVTSGMDPHAGHGH